MIYNKDFFSQYNCIKVTKIEEQSIVIIIDGYERIHIAVKSYILMQVCQFLVNEINRICKHNEVHNSSRRSVVSLTQKSIRRPHLTYSNAVSNVFVPNK